MRPNGPVPTPCCMLRYRFPESRCRRILTPLADNYARRFLAGAESAICRNLSRRSAPHVGGGYLRICPLAVTAMARRSSRKVNGFPVRSAAEFAHIDYGRLTTMPSWEDDAHRSADSRRPLSSNAFDRPNVGGRPDNGPLSLPPTIALTQLGQRHHLQPSVGCTWGPPVSVGSPAQQNGRSSAARTACRPSGICRQIGGTMRVLLASPSLSVTLSIDEILRPSYVWCVATDPLEALSAVVKRSSS